MSDLQRGLEALANSAEAYKEAESYYTGTVDEFFSSAKIAAALRRGGGKNSFRLTFSAIPVDARVDRIEVGSITAPKRPELDAVIAERIVEPNDLDQDLDDYFRKAAMFGDYYMLVWEGDEDEDDDESGESTVTSVEIFANSPLAMRTIYSRENNRHALFTIKVWETDDSTKDEPKWRANLYYRDRIEEYVSKKGMKDSTDDSAWDELYEFDDEGNVIEDSWPIPNPYGKLPAFHFRQGGKPYGEPVHKRAWGAQDAINKLNTSHMGTIDFQVFPQRYALIDGESEGADTGDDFIEFDTSGVGVGDPESTPVTDVTKAKSKLKSGPGETWWLEGVKSVGQWAAADGKAFMEPEVFQIRAMSVLAKTPLYEFDTTGAAPSGESRRRADAPLSKSVRAMERGYGQTLENAVSFGLLILGYADVKVEVKFKTNELVTAKEDWDVIAIKLSSGVPLRQVLNEAGYDDTEIETWYPLGLPALAPATIVELAGALSSLGQAVTLQSVTNEDVRAALPMFFADDRAEEPVEPVEEEPVLEDPTDPDLVEAQLAKERALAMKALVDAGVTPEAAAEEVGLGGIELDEPAPVPAALAPFAGTVPPEPVEPEPVIPPEV